MTHSPISVNRDFKGIWIPREIWLAKALCPQAKCLWAEIHSLYDRDRGGCYASNEYLANFCGLQERRIRELISQLKDFGLVEQVSFDGRTRVLVALLPLENWDGNPPKKETGRKMPGRPAEKCRAEKPQKDGKESPGRPAEKCRADRNSAAGLSLYREQSRAITTLTPPTPPLSDGESSHAAIAAEVENSSSSRKPKKQKAFDEHVIELAGQMIAMIAKHNPVYRRPADMTNFYQAVHDMIVDDQQDPAVVLKVFEWVCADLEQRGDFKGWHSIVCTNKQGRKSTNPAEIFRSRFSSLYAQMKSKPNRKFAPSSDDDAALAAWNKGMESAL